MSKNIYPDSSEAGKFLAEQIECWPVAKSNYKKLDYVLLKEFDMGGFTIKVQFTPSRIISTNAKVDLASVQKRKCFLCPHNLPEEQYGLPFGTHYTVLCNPYPIFREHFTVPDKEHLPQEIDSRFGDFLKLAKSLKDYSTFYNGPKSGASAPDHAHFQTVTRYQMPLDNEWHELWEKNTPIITLPDGELKSLTGYLRNGFLIKGENANTVEKLFRKVYLAMPGGPDNTEPCMNLFGFYEDNNWHITIIPRKKHRPSQFYNEGDAQLLVSPGAADMGGLFITARKEDFEKMNKQLLEDIYRQVGYSREEIIKTEKIIRNNEL